MAYSKTYISENELSKLIGASNITSLKKELGVYAKYEGPVVRIVEFERHCQIREDDVSVEKLLVNLLSVMCRSEESISSLLADGKTVEGAYLAFSEENLTRPFTNNPTLEDAIYVFSELKNRQHIRTLLNTALQTPEFSRLARSRAVKGFHSLLSDIEENRNLKTKLEYHNLLLKGRYSWVADVIYRYRGDSNIVETRYLNGIVSLTDTTPNKDTVYISECSDNELIGRNVSLENEVLDEHILFDKDVYLAEARSRNIPIGDYDTSVTSTSAGSVHPTRETYLNMIERLVELFKVRCKNFNLDSIDTAIELLNKKEKHDTHFSIKINSLKRQTLKKYLDKKEAEEELHYRGRAPYLKAISSLSHAITNTVKTSAPNEKDLIAEKISRLSKTERISSTISKEEILLFLRD